MANYCFNQKTLVGAELFLTIGSPGARMGRRPSLSLSLFLSLSLRSSNNSGPVLKAIGDDLTRIVTLFARSIYEDRVQHRNRCV